MPPCARSTPRTPSRRGCPSPFSARGRWTLWREPADVDAQTVARNALACLDLTSLNDDDTTSAIDALCDRALGAGDTLGIRPAAVCVFPRFVAQCAARLQGSGVRLAAVANFPDGDGAVEAVLDEADASL